MSASTIAFGIVLGLAAGVLAGMFGVGGGILFVPTLVALGLGQLEAQGTSLLAILPTVLVGAWSQRRYGNLRVRTAVVVGLASIVGVEIGAQDRHGASGDHVAHAVRHPALRRRRPARLENAPQKPALP